MAIRPFRLTLSPVVFWAGIMFCLNLTWAVGIAVTLSQIFSALPPYNFTVSQVGLCNLSAFVASMLAVPLADPLGEGLQSFVRRGTRVFMRFDPDQLVLNLARIPSLDDRCHRILCVWCVHQSTDGVACDSCRRIGIAPTR